MTGEEATEAMRRAVESAKEKSAEPNEASSQSNSS
jgi:hypothetical protein